MRKILIAVYAVSLLSAAGVAGASAQSMAGHDMKGMDMSKGGMKGHAQMGRDAPKMDEMRMSKAMMAAKARSITDTLPTITLDTFSTIFWAMLVADWASFNCLSDCWLQTGIRLDS